MIIYLTLSSLVIIIYFLNFKQTFGATKIYAYMSSIILTTKIQNVEEHKLKYNGCNCSFNSFLTT